MFHNTLHLNFEVFLTSKLYIIANTTDGQMDGEADRAITEYIPSKDGCIKWHNFFCETFMQMYTKWNISYDPFGLQLLH